MLRQNARQIIAGLALIGAFSVFLYYLLSTLAHFLGSLDQPLIVAILAASGTVLAATFTVVVGRIFERKKETEAHFRQRKYELYYDLLKLLYELTTPPADTLDVVKRLTEWQRNLILFSGPKTIRNYVAWMSNLKSGRHTLRTVMLMEEFYKSLRSDLGISNLGLQQGDIANLVLRHGELYLQMAKKNPDMSLADLVEMEKALDAAVAKNIADALKLAPT